MVIVGLGIWTINLRMKSGRGHSETQTYTHSNVPADQSKVLKPALVESTTSILSNQVPKDRAAAGTLGPSRARPDEEWKSFLEKFDSQAKWNIQRDGQGRPLIVAGGIVRLPQMGLKSASDWAKELARLSGIPPEQIRDTGEFLPETDFSRTYHLPQMVGEYLIEGAFIRVFERKDDGAIYYTALETRDVGSPDLTINISAAQAQGIAVSELSKSFGGVEVVGADSNPRVFMTSPGFSELVWRLEVHIAQPKHDERELLISAKSGKILRVTGLLHY